MFRLYSTSGGTPYRVKHSRRMLFSGCVWSLMVFAPFWAVTALDGQGDRTAEFDKWARSAYEAQHAGNPTEAIAALKQALQIRPDWADGAFYLATMYFGT